MKHAEAEKLLGGYATGTLTEAERQVLFAAALEHQDLFDALMQEEALKSLLANPEAKASLLAALAPAAPPKVIPFWRRPGLLGAAASLMVATLAGLAYLRSPVLQQEAPKPMPVQAPAPPLQEQKRAEAPRKEVLQMTKATQPPSPGTQRVPMAAPSGASQGAIAGFAPQAPLPVAEEAARAKRVASAQPEFDAQAGATKDMTRAVPRRVPEGVISGVVGGVVAGAAGPPPSPLAFAEKAENRSSGASLPLHWTLEQATQGMTQVTVLAPREALLVIIKRGAAGVEVLDLPWQGEDSPEGVSRRAQVRLKPGDVLDLYRLNHPVADPSKLPETGPVDGFRARIYPTK